MPSPGLSDVDLLGKYVAEPVPSVGNDCLAGGLSGGTIPNTDNAEGSCGGLGGLPLGLFPNLPISPLFGLSLANCIFVRYCLTFIVVIQ